MQEKNLIIIENEDIFLAQVQRNIQELRDCNCPQKVIDMLEEWLLDLLCDRQKYREWIKACKLPESSMKT